MLHIPGQYSGGETAEYRWTQTKAELEVRVPLPAGLADGSVTCEILPRSFALRAGEEAVAVGGELAAVVVVDDSLWSVERDGSRAEAVLSLRKAVAELWPRLLASDAEEAAEPRLLDGLERKAPTDKNELLRQAKERAKGALDGPSKAVQHVVEGRSGERIALNASGLPPLPVITLRKCTDCEVVLGEGVAAVKLLVEGCVNTTVAVNGKVLTETIELWQCEGVAVKIASAMRTVQLDACSGVKLQYARAADFDRCLTAGVFDLALSFADAPSLDGEVDLGTLRAQMPDKGLSAETDQFISRHVEGALLTELIVRLSNDFPTTEREVADFAAKTRMKSDKIDEVVQGMLGSSLGRELSGAERQQMVEMVKSQSEAAAKAQHTAEGTAAGRHLARVEFKKAAGNEAFKAGEYQQAAVAYTEALSLAASGPEDCGEGGTVDPAIASATRCNRAACFLKLGRYAQAREDAEAAAALQPSYAKAHFRLALALQAEEKFPEAVAAFNKALQLEPKNKEAAAGLRMAEVQATRQRRQQQQ